MTGSLTLRGARLWGVSDAVMDVTVVGGIVSTVTPHRSGEAPSGEVIDLQGRWLIPGLVDHHAHFTLWAKHRARFSLAGMPTAASAADAVSLAVADAVAGGRAPAATVVGRGFQDALWPDAPTVALLDEAAARAGCPTAPVVLLSHDLHSVWINTAAARRYSARAGLLTEHEAFELEIALEADEAHDASRVDALVADAARAAAERGVTGIMDLEMADNPAVWQRRVRAGLRSLRVKAGVYPQHLPASLGREERTGSVVPGTHGLVTVGPLKVFADGALNSRTAWCFDAYPAGADGAGFGEAAHGASELKRILADARSHGFEVALHAIGDRAVAVALDAFEESGAAGSVEHAQLVRLEDLERFAALGVAAGIHPEHAMDDRPVSDELWRGRTDRAFPYGSLARAGATLRLGSDAPVSPLDPWLGISAAVHRTRDELAPWEPENALSLAAAFAASWASPSVAAGIAADLAVLDADPAQLDPVALRKMTVALTVTAGRVTHRAL